MLQYNAVVHRSYLNHGTIQVAVYDNWLEITSPGKLPMGQTMERMKEGYSKIRNETLAHAFSSKYPVAFPRLSSNINFKPLTLLLCLFNTFFLFLNLIVIPLYQ